ncbi:act1 [Symbiodinium natans]|uniref:Act1 protein n=1 Tax=Symbiodinium natans TaxID=878477 RepID=A0A812LB31_9DINO|nr:act1 [Symbiodinium natans]
MFGPCLDGEVLWLPILSEERVLCLRLVPDSPLMSNAAHIMDACMALETTRSRMEATETDVTGPTLNILRQLGKWPQETCASMLQLDDMKAVGMGSNIKNRRRATYVAMGLAYVIRAGERGHVNVTQTVNDFHISSLATEAWTTRRQPLNYPAIHEPGAPGAPGVPGGPGAPGAPSGSGRPPLAPPSTAGEMQMRARHLGAAEDCVQDPFMIVDETVSGVLCIACNKHFTPEHLTTRRHLNYLSDIQGTLMWLTREQKPPCLRILQFQETRAQPNAGVPYQDPSTRSAQTETAGPETAWDDTYQPETEASPAAPAQQRGAPPASTPGSWEERADRADRADRATPLRPQVNRRWRDVEIPATPSLEENYDFAWRLFANHTQYLSRFLVFNDEIGVEEV